MLKENFLKIMMRSNLRKLLELNGVLSYIYIGWPQTTTYTAYVCIPNFTTQCPVMNRN